MGAYIERRGGTYHRPSEVEVLTPETAEALFSHFHWKGPATIVNLGDGSEAIYTFSSWKPGQRPLSLIRYADGSEPDPLRNPYSDPAIDSLIRTPRNHPFRTYTLACNACGRFATVTARVQTDSYAGYRRLGWSNTKARGWCCPRHKYRRMHRGHKLKWPIFRDSDYDIDGEQYRTYRERRKELTHGDTTYDRDLEAGPGPDRLGDGTTD